MPQRDDFSEATKRALAARVGNLCSNPNCRALTSGPHEDATKAVDLGVPAHVATTASGGPRYDATLTVEQRAAIENALWLCQNCAKLIDSDPVRFPVELLLKWRAMAEAEARSRMGKTSVQAPMGGSTFIVNIEGSTVGSLAVGDGSTSNGRVDMREVVEQQPAPATTTPDRSAPRQCIRVEFTNFGPDTETAAILAELEVLLSPLAIDVEGVYGVALSAKTPVFATVRFINATAAFLDKTASKASELATLLKVRSERIQRSFENWPGFGFRLDVEGVEHVLYTDLPEKQEHLLMALHRFPAYWTAWGRTIPILVQPGIMHRIYWCYRGGHWLPATGWSRTPHTNEDFREHWSVIDEVVRRVAIEVPPTPAKTATPASVYLSYGDEDVPFAQKLYEALEASGVPVFFRSEHAIPGTKHHRSARRNIREYEHVVLLCSEHSLCASNVLSELDEMLSREFDDGASERIIPILLDDYVREDWAPRHADLKRAVLDRVLLDMKGAEGDRSKFDKAVKRLLRALKG
ncbi:toll/interleukin-1 receptor domain-containing protein [Sorangium sp. So ce367]|uniref:toll/interleukin-1 receptor domain-containing protein n=1 Tax=Sorangium sp. So ce367 TaxID=3133305 RepID=UPI003F6489A8